MEENFSLRGIWEINERRTPAQYNQLIDWRSTSPPAFYSNMTPSTSVMVSKIFRQKSKHTVGEK